MFLASNLFYLFYESVHEETVGSKIVKWVLIGVSVLFLVVMLLLPLETIRVQAGPEEPTGLFALVNNITEAVRGMQLLKLSMTRLRIKMRQQLKKF